MTRPSVQFSPLDTLRELGVLSNSVEAELFVQEIRSSAGRAFGSQSATEYPKHLIELANICLTAIAEGNDDDRERCRTIIDSKVSSGRSRRLTHLNEVLAQIVFEVQNGSLTLNAPQAANCDRSTFISRILHKFGFTKFLTALRDI